MINKKQLFGFQHQNENLERDTFLGNFLQLQVDLLLKILQLYLYRSEWNMNGYIKFTPSFAPGFIMKVMEKI